MNQYKKRADETELQYGWRLFIHVRNGEMSWQELADLINRDCRSDESEYRTESAYRKPLQSAEKYYNEVFSKITTDNDVLNEIKEQRRELEKERQKLNATKVEYTRQLRHQSRFELFYENIANQINTLKVPNHIRENRKENDKEYILTIADIHAGANFIIDTNSYSFDEITRRFNKLFNDVVGFICRNNLNRLKVVCLGDDIQGILRLSDLQLNESSVVEATVFVAKTIANFLNDLSAYCDIDYYHVPKSNHSQSRPLGTKASELASEDVEYIICNYIKDVLINNDSISVHTNFGYDYIEIPVFDFKTIALHGHTIKNIDNALKDLTYHKKTFYTTAFLAHFHASKSGTVGEMADTDCEIIVCPSFVGSCPYSDKLMKGARPSCSILGYDEKYGHTETYKIFLT